ncbi:MAG: hypothetical protein WCJ30_01205, partial [Deltaproteobacteria bacterium]
MKPAILALGIVAMAAPRASLADPLVLRGPDVGQGFAVAIGSPDASLGGWITPRIGVALEWRAPAMIGASVGTRFTLVGRPRGGGIDLHGAVGLRGLRYDPGLAVSATVALQARYRSEGFWFSAGLVSSSALQFVGGIDARLPLMLEIALAGRVGRVWLGVQGGAGMVFVPGLS